MGNLQSNPSSSTQTIEKRFDVFLNFVGETRDGFTNYLYEALRAKSIDAFMDESGHEKGDEIWLNFKKTIRDSTISVVIFSKEYASSKLRLRELVEIMECRENGQIVIPVFYNVAVSDVRNQEGSFKDGFDQLQQKFYKKLAKDKAAWIDSADPRSLLHYCQSNGCMACSEERENEFFQEMENWKEALNKASRIKGWNSSVTRPESKLVDEMVKDISEKLNKAYRLSPRDVEGVVGSRDHLSRGPSNAKLVVPSQIKERRRESGLKTCVWKLIRILEVKRKEAEKVICKVLVRDKNCQSNLFSWAKASGGIFY